MSLILCGKLEGLEQHNYCHLPTNEFERVSLFYLINRIAEALTVAFRANPSLENAMPELKLRRAVAAGSLKFRDILDG